MEEGYAANMSHFILFSPIVVSLLPVRVWPVSLAPSLVPSSPSLAYLGICSLQGDYSPAKTKFRSGVRRNYEWIAS
jgi:hypothetical protein